MRRIHTSQEGDPGPPPVALIIRARRAEGSAPAMLWVPGGLGSDDFLAANANAGSAVVRTSATATSDRPDPRGIGAGLE
jgi:hypothetical protein